jgi:2-hydroxychromene-2-carboxylate isomerase
VSELGQENNALAAPIDFYFDFSSPYGYLASTRIDALAAKHGRDVVWHPILLGVMFKQTGSAPLTQIPLKGEYARRDFVRTARHLGVERFRLPDRFPIPSQAPARSVLWVRARDPGASKALAKALYAAYFAEGVDISDPEAVVRIAASLGHDPAAVRTAIHDPAIKQALVIENEQAMARGVFGSPFVFVDDEPFWGSDRLEQIERWLADPEFRAQATGDR